MMKVEILFFFALFAALNALNKNQPHVLATDNPPCATNASTAFVDVILVIDTSANMGSSNLRKIGNTVSLILSKFTIGNMVDIRQGYRNTRVGVVTYDATAKIAANYTDINSISDLTNVLNGISASNSQQANLYDGLTKAFYIQTNCSDVNNCSIGYYYMRPTAMIVFAASSNSDNFGQIPGLVKDADFFDDGTIITVNFNTADQALTNLLNQMTYNNWVNASMYNFVSSSNTLSRNLEWSIYQANCYCGDDFGIPVVIFDSTNNRYTRVAECMDLNLCEGQYPDDTVDMCQWYKNEERISAFILSSARQKFIENTWMGIFPFNGQIDYPYYFGLHKNNQSQWSYWNYDRSEFPIGSYTNWGKGYPNGTDGCAILDSDDGVTLVWKTYSCDTDSTGLAMVLCQARACDTSSTICWPFSQTSGSMKPKQKVYTSTGEKSKKNFIKRWTMKDGKPMRIA